MQNISPNFDLYSTIVWEQNQCKRSLQYLLLAFKIEVQARILGAEVICYSGYLCDAAAKADLTLQQVLVSSQKCEDLSGIFWHLLCLNYAFTEFVENCLVIRYNSIWKIISFFISQIS